MGFRLYGSRFHCGYGETSFRKDFGFIWQFQAGCKKGLGCQAKDVGLAYLSTYSIRFLQGIGVVRTETFTDLLNLIPRT